jgi:hypothetical protein
MGGDTVAKNNGFLFFYDWEKPMRRLSGEDFKALFWAMFDYQVNGTPPPELDGDAGLISDFVFPQLERRAERAEAGRSSVQKRWRKEWQEYAPDSNVLGTYYEPNTQDKTKTRQRQNKDDTPPKSPSGGRAAKAARAPAEGFEQFWEAYPRRQAKQAAQAAWDKLRPGAELREQILAALSAQKRSAAWREQDGKFIPLPATYINGKRWEDQIMDSVPVPECPDWLERLS